MIEGDRRDERSSQRRGPGCSAHSCTSGFVLQSLLRDEGSERREEERNTRIGVRTASVLKSERAECGSAERRGGRRRRDVVLERKVQSKDEGSLWRAIMVMYILDRMF